MSDIEDLSEIADQQAFGRGSNSLSHSGATGMRGPRCNSPEHMKGANIRVYRQGNRVRTVCKLCDKARRRAKKPSYNMRGYPL